MPIDRRTFSTALLAATAASLLLSRGMAASAPTKARNVVLVHGLFADGSCWTEVIPRLQSAGLNVTSVQNPLTTLPEAVAAAERVLARQDGPTVLVGHSFSGMIDMGKHRQALGVNLGLVAFHGLFRTKTALHRDQSIRGHRLYSQSPTIAVNANAAALAKRAISASPNGAL